MKNKRSIITVILLVLLTLAVCVTSGCSKTENKNVTKIRIITGSFEDTYTLDEKPDLTNAKILVTYSDNTTSNEPITADMVKGLDTSHTTNEGKLTVTFRGFTDTFNYKVVSSTTIETAFRLVLSAEKQSEKVYATTVKASGVDKVEGGVYAISFTAVGSGGATVGEITKSLSAEWQMSVHRNSATSVKVVLYSVSGSEPLPANAALVAFEVTKSVNAGAINLQSATISDGKRDYVVPAVSAPIA